MRFRPISKREVELYGQDIIDSLLHFKLKYAEDLVIILLMECLAFKE
jgi:hypothetical protein